MSTPKGWPTQEKDQRLVPQFATVEPVHTLQHGLSVLAHQYVYEVATDAAEAGSSAIAIVATAHSAQAGDVIRLTSGALSGREIKVYSTETNLITLAEELPSAIATGVTFQILRHKYPLVEPTGETKITGTLTATFSEEAVSADGGALPAKVKVAGGYDGSAVQVLKTDANGELQIDVLSSALPTGAATEATLSALSAKIPALASSGGIPVEVLQQDGLLDTGNTTAVALGAGGVFTGTWKDGTNWSAFQLGVFSNQASATNGVNVQFSYDGVTVHHNHYYTYAGGSSGIGYAFPVEFRYFRVVYTNNSVAQATFRLITVLKANSIQPSQYRLINALSDETQASVTRSLIFGKTTGGGGGYVDVKVNPSGALTVEATVTSSALPTGAATEATLSTRASETTLSILNTKVPSQGQALMAASVPVVIASNQTAIPVSGSFSAATKSVVDLLDANILDTSSTNIPGSASSPVQVVASLAAAVTALQLLDTTGAFVGVYVGASGSEVLKLVMGPGSDQTIEHSIPSGSRVSLKRLDSTTAVSSGIVAINFLG
jgi:hypothetical protein